MSNIKTDIANDFGDGEVEIIMTLQFTIWDPDTFISDMEAEFQKVVDRYAI